MAVTIPEATRAVIRVLRRRAENAPVHLDDVLAQTLVSRSQFGDITVDGVVWFVGYSLEHQLAEQDGRFGTVLCRHLTISHPNRETLPSGEVADAIAVEFGFNEPGQVEARRVFPGRYEKRGMTLHYIEIAEAFASSPSAQSAQGT